MALSGTSSYTPMNSEKPQLSSVSVAELQQYSFLRSMHNLADPRAILWILGGMGGTAGLLQHLQTSLIGGINSASVHERAKLCIEYRFGRNWQDIQESATFKRFVSEVLTNWNLRILAACTFLLTLVGTIRNPQSGWVEGAAIILITGVIVLVSAAFAKYKFSLKQRLPASVTVIRDGKTQEISASDLVVGDVVKINSGCIIEADGIVIESSGLKVEASAIFGEYEPMPKDVFRNAQQFPLPVLFCSSRVTEGSGAMVVIAVGSNTLQCRVMKVHEEASPVTSQQSALEELAGKFGIAGVLTAFAVLLILLAYVIFGTLSEDSWGVDGWYYLFTTFSITVAIIIIAVPGELSLVGDLALAYSLERINTQNVLIKRYQTFETSNEVTDLCADKTGTLTRNRMSVVEICTSERKYEEQQIEQLANEPIAHLLIYAFCIGNNVEIVPSTVSGGHDEFRGSATDCAMAEAVKKWEVDINDVRNQFPVLSRIPFNSMRKWEAAVASINGENTIFLKGAVERVIALCKYRNVKGQVEELREAEKRRLLEEAASTRGLRVLGVAYKVDHPSHLVGAKLDESSVTEDLVLLATVGFKNTLRTEVPSVLATLRRAGIACRMITGDNSEAAVAIAKECGIIDEESDGAVMDGLAFDQVCSDPQALQEACKNVRVLARATPQQKSIFVEGLQKLGKTVAFAGDGVNDALAIKKANVSFAMNLAGSDLAKNAADVLLVNDDFIGIVTTLKWSRNIMRCIREYAKFQIKSATTVLAVEFIGSLVLGHSPLTVIQILWVYIIVDVLAPAAIVMKEPPNELLEQDSIPTRPLVTAAGKFQITVGVLYEVFCVIAVLLLAPSVLGVSASSYCIDWSEDCERHRTLIFHTLALLQVCSLLWSQGPSVVKEICRCGALTSVLVIVLAVQFAMVQFGGAVMRCAQLTLQEHVFCMAIGLSSLLFCSLVKPSETVSSNAKAD